MMRRFAPTAALAARTAQAAWYSTPGKVKVNVKMQDGTDVAFDAPVGTSLMSAVRDVAKLEMEGACDGCMQCGTCHVYLSQTWFDKLGKPAEQEVDLLDNALDVKDTSRLACQIELTAAHDGIEVQLPKNVANLLM